LDASLSSLKLIQNNAIIIACDSSVSAMLDAGIRPHIVVTADIFETNFVKIRHRVDQLRDTLLIYGIESNPDNVRKFLGQKRLAVSCNSKILLDWLGPKFNLDFRLPPLTSVSQMSLFLAQALGADPIILVGMDLSYPNGSSHAAGSIMQVNLNLEKSTSIPGVNGNRVASSPQLIADKVFIESVTTKSRIPFIHTSMDGALVQGTTIKSIKEITTTDLNSNADVNGVLAKIDLFTSICESEALDALNEMLANVNQLKECCEFSEEKLTEVIEKNDVQWGTESLNKQLKDLKQYFDDFQQDHSILFEILELAIGKEIHEILKKREKIAANHYVDQKQKLWDEIGLIRDNYWAYGKAADFFAKKLYKAIANLNLASVLKQKNVENAIGDKWDNLFKLGNHYAEIGEIWQAEREYKTALEIRPEDPAPWVGMVKMFADSELWRPARDNVERARSSFPNNTELIKLQADIEDKIREIMNQIKDAWITGDKETTRRLLSGYLLLCPDDEQANLLKEVLKEVDATLAAGSPIVKQQKKSQLPFDELVANASRFIEKLEFEPAIGIMEGLIKNYPQKAAALREKIGDIRMLQTDYPSAIWNNRRALKAAPQDADLCAKIEKAKRLEISP
jgi:tetratricopeptide (TPR) repeat protein